MTGVLRGAEGGREIKRERKLDPRTVPFISSLGEILFDLIHGCVFSSFRLCH